MRTFKEARARAVKRAEKASAKLDAAREELAYIDVAEEAARERARAAQADAAELSAAQKRATAGE